MHYTLVAYNAFRLVFRFKRKKNNNRNTYSWKFRLSDLCGLGKQDHGSIQNTQADARWANRICNSNEGVNFIDTAENDPWRLQVETYGDTERYIGNWLSLMPATTWKTDYSYQIAFRVSVLRGMRWLVVLLSDKRFDDSWRDYKLNYIDVYSALPNRISPQLRVHIGRTSVMPSKQNVKAKKNVWENIGFRIGKGTESGKIRHGTSERYKRGESYIWIFEQLGSG